MLVKDINIKNHTYYYFDDIINIKDFDPSNIKIDEQSYENIFIYYIGYVSIKKVLKVYSVNPLYIVFGKENGCFEEISGNKYQKQVPTNENKEKIKKYEKLWFKTRNFVRSITRNLNDSNEKYIKIKLDPDEKFPLNKAVEVPIVTTVVWFVFHENNKYYPKILFKLMSV